MSAWAEIEGDPANVLQAQLYRFHYDTAQVANSVAGVDRVR